jgi:Cyclin, N-terminal domain
MQIHDTIGQEILNLGKRLELKSPTRYLALTIGCSFAASIEQNIPSLRVREIAQAAVLIAGKIRERDSECPSVSAVCKAARQSHTSREVKAAEVQLHIFFDWNYMFKTPYDYLEMFLVIGVLLTTDTLRSVSPGISPLSDFRSEIMRIEDEINVEAEHIDRSSPKNQESNIKHSAATPSTFAGQLVVGSLEPERQTNLRRSIREKATDFLEYLMTRIVINPDEYKTLAYAVVCYSRKWNQITEEE